MLEVQVPGYPVAQSCD